MGKGYVADFNTGKPDDFIRFVSEDFLRKEGFALTTVKGEVVWKKGKGLLAAPQFLKLQYANGVVHLEAWLKYAILPGVYCGEMGLDGAMAFAIKAALRDKVNALVALLYQPVNIPPQPAPVPVAPGAGPVPVGNGVSMSPVMQPADPDAPMNPMDPETAAGHSIPVPAVSSDPSMPASGAVTPVPGYAPAPGYAASQPIPVAVHNPTGKAVLSLVMGLCSVLGCFIPLVGVVTGIIGIPSGILGRRTTARGMATAGLALSIVFLIVSILNWIAGIVLLFM